LGHVTHTCYNTSRFTRIRWWRPMRCLMFTGRFAQKSPIIGG